MSRIPTGPAGRVKPGFPGSGRAPLPTAVVDMPARAASAAWPNQMRVAMNGIRPKYEVYVAVNEVTRRAMLAQDSQLALLVRIAEAVMVADPMPEF